MSLLTLLSSSGNNPDKTARANQRAVVSHIAQELLGKYASANHSVVVSATSRETGNQSAGASHSVAIGHSSSESLGRSASASQTIDITSATVEVIGNTASASHAVSVGSSSSETVGGSGISALHIEIPNEVAWQALKDLAITVGASTTDIMPTLTRSSTSIVDSFDDLSAGEYGTDSDYDANDGEWDNAGWNDGANTANTGGSPHWTDSGSVGMNIYIKFASDVSLRDIRALIWAPQTYTYDPANWVFKDGDGNVLTPTRPSSATDYEHSYDTSNKSYQFTF